MTISAFQKTVLKYYKEYGRHELPWRKTHDPYKILVSEVMLQQTQVDRVKPFYTAFLKRFPTSKALAEAPLSDVLTLWQGLGYNRRAKMLQEGMKDVWRNNKGHFPKTVEGLEELRGVGPYTARAIMAFAYNEPVVFIETNLRTVVTHHFFADQEKVDDREILKILSKVYPEKIKDISSREWNAALMDYGSHLKRSGVRINSKSKTYNKQSQFSGSGRQARGAILKELIKGPQTKTRLTKLLGDDRIPQMEQQLQKLLSEGLIEKDGTRFRLPS
jgi:A/G-specific adenine glycosylase